MREFTMPYSQSIKNLGPVNQPLIDYFNQGGLVFLMVTFKNPWNNSYAGDTTNAGNLNDIITPGHPANIQFKDYLVSVAAGISQLQDSGITVIFRPFQEQNGSWFWWGSRSATLPATGDFIALWQYTFDYLTTTKQLHNILWLFCPSIKGPNVMNPSFQSELHFYPGNNYVDIIGLDQYNDTLDMSTTAYSDLLATGKPLGLAEFGPEKTSVTNHPFVYDYTTLIDQIRTKFPAFCFWASWNHFKSGANWIYYSMSTQNNIDSLLHDPWVVNRDDINFSNCLTTSIDVQSFPETVFCFPNPFTSQTIIQSEFLLNDATLIIYNGFGQKVTEQKGISGQAIALSRGNLKAGLYFIRINQGEKIVGAQKLLVADE
jgi:mannan endo-1,4-beta-mannosidase